MTHYWHVEVNMETPTQEPSSQDVNPGTQKSPIPRYLNPDFVTGVTAPPLALALSCITIMTINAHRAAISRA